MFKYLTKFFNTNMFFLLLLIIVAFSLYGKSINFELTKFDDDTLITTNINFISGFRNIPKLFVKSVFYDDNIPYYRPVLTLSFAIESLFVRDNLRLYHLTNIILFILSLYLFYLFCKELNLNSTITKFVLLIIAVHPMFASVVVWIPGRNDSLLTVFFLLSFVFFIRYVNSQKIKYAFYFVLSSFFAIFTKETFILLLPLYFVYLFLYEHKISKKNIGMLFICLMPFVLLFFVLRSFSIETFGYEHYILKINIVVLNFIKYSFIFFYNFFVPEYIPIMLLNAALSLKIIFYNCLFMSILIFVLYRKILSRKIFFIAIFLIFLSLLPPFFQEKFIYLNHRFFICSIGIVICLVNILNYLIDKFNNTKKILISFFCLFFGCFFYLSYEQSNKYKNHDTFWIKAYLDSPNYYVTNQHLSHIYFSRGDIEKAEYYAKKAIELKSNYSTLIGYANLLMVKGDLKEAKIAFLEMEKDMNGSKELLYYPLSEIYYQEKDNEKALGYALKAYNIKPYDINYCKQLIKIYDTMENYNEELKIYEYLLSCDRKNEMYKNKIEELKQKTVYNDLTNA